MKTKNKKILTRFSAVLATCLLLVALAVPCFADETEPIQYVLQEMNFDNYADAYAFISQNFELISRIVLPDADITMVVVPSLIPNTNTDPSYVFTCFGLIVTSSGSAISSNFSLVLTEEEVVVGTVSGAVNSTQLIDSVVLPISQFEYVDISIYAYVPAELTPAPIDPDAPTRTGLYGELYHIIRDAIYGENALLDSTQEFTLTQIATWMTYIVILLPLVVIAIILFKIFVR